jgi:hypothetical protein
MSIEKQLNDIITKRIDAISKNAVTDQVLKKVGEGATQQIIKRTRLGKGVRPVGGSVFNLLPLKNSTVDYRDRYDFNLSNFTTPTRSNLTATGQLLDSITYRVFRAGGIKGIELFFKENRRRELSGGPARTTHKEINRHVEKGGRPFFYLADFEIEKLKGIIFQELSGN